MTKRTPFIILVPIVLLLFTLFWFGRDRESQMESEGSEIKDVQTHEGTDVGLPKEIIAEDGAPMVLIPEGEFQMGSDDGEYHEGPVHAVYVDAFYMDKHEVTNAQYRRFVKATGHSEPGRDFYGDTVWTDRDFNKDGQPVVCVFWEDALAYCEWADKRLPTEAEWEKAARGGLVGAKYPWGDSITHNDANYDGVGGNDKWHFSASVGSFLPNGYGLYDMAGNVSEWCADWYYVDYYSDSPDRNPRGPASGGSHVLRGGSWDDFVDDVRVACRATLPPTYTDGSVGFRCARDVSP